MLDVFFVNNPRTNSVIFLDYETNISFLRQILHFDRSNPFNNIHILFQHCHRIWRLSLVARCLLCQPFPNEKTIKKQKQNSQSERSNQNPDQIQSCKDHSFVLIVRCIPERLFFRKSNHFFHISCGLWNKNYFASSSHLFNAPFLVLNVYLEYGKTNSSPSHLETI